ncbi:LD-carboxypeptidase [Halobacillus salinarum]|uniref:LD-carboxypeptidase n=1 Tax=Halobacillus salinarum TaxID=2932257 RepID=A0ABY4EF47_9BACI|nr:LD-carboxypeptidase [Halobacillus salinarum]UOQ43089.1 LD-carboxypeptidase [Halobacillus salinarum]
MIQPKALRRGDAVGVIAPASSPDQRKLTRGIQFLQSLGLKVYLGRTVTEKQGYLAGSDQVRLGDLHEMFLNPYIRAVFCARGGYGTARIAEGIDYDLIKCHPKIFWGYSDITYLHMAIQKFTGLVTFHGPMIVSDFNSAARFSFLQLFQPLGLAYNDRISPLQVIAEGKRAGSLTGGNLTVLTDTIGTPFEIETIGKILVIEDVNEPVYRIDAMLQQLKSSGKFNGIQGVVIGDFTMDKDQEAYSKELDYFFRCFFQSAPFPVLSGFKFGHGRRNYGLAFGVNACIDTAGKLLTAEPGIQL